MSSPASANAWPHVQAQGYRIYQSGSHFHGDFMRVYVPDAAAVAGTPLRAIIYLHGFSLCMPSFYEKHLQYLAQQGYIVFFPDFQRSCYPNTPPGQHLSALARPEVAHWRHWLKVARQLPQEQEHRLALSETPSLWPEVCEQSDTGTLSRGLSKPTAGGLRRVAWALVVIIGLLNLIRWFRREYGKNLIHLLSTVGLSLAHEPVEWLSNAITLTEDAWERLLSDYPHWAASDVDWKSFAFGHSLGGLIALSLPAGFDKAAKGGTGSRFFPQRIVVADPTPSTEMGIPGFAIALLKLFKSPFTNAPITIQKTGDSLEQPVAILHGGSDNIVKPGSWVDKAKGDPRSNYQAIASAHKAIYFSYSNPDPQLQLIAFHNQAVTDTRYYDAGLFKHFGGVKTQPNAYNFDYVWPGTHQIFSGTATPQDLLQHLNPREFEIKAQPPPSDKSGTRLIWMVGLFLLLLAGAYGYWHGAF